MVTWAVCIITFFVECIPVELYWNIIQTPPQCAVRRFLQTNILGGGPICRIFYWFYTESGMQIDSLPMRVTNSLQPFAVIVTEVVSFWNLFRRTLGLIHITDEHFNESNSDGHTTSNTSAADTPTQVRHPIPHTQPYICEREADEWLQRELLRLIALYAGGILVCSFPSVILDFSWMDTGHHRRICPSSCRTVRFARSKWIDMGSGESNFSWIPYLITDAFIQSECFLAVSFSPARDSWTFLDMELTMLADCFRQCPRSSRYLPPRL